VAFAEYADTGETGEVAERAGLAPPVEQVVVRRKQFVESALYVCCAAGASDTFLCGGINLHLNAGSGEAFEKLRKRFVFGRKPQAVLVEPEFQHGGLRRKRAKAKG